MKTIRAGIIQFDVKLGDVDSNLKRAKQHIRRLANQGVKMIVLPEMWSTGFANKELDRLAETTPDILGEISLLAKETNTIIIGSLPEKVEKKIFNTAYLVDERGAISATYQKIHLFSLTGEDQWFNGGRKGVVCSTSVGPVGLLICYDLRFPELCRSLTLKGAKIVVVMAQWPDSRAAHWKTLLAARAIENQVFVLAANRCGQDHDLVYAGHSRIISPCGEVLARAGKKGTSITADIDFKLLDRFRKTIPCLRERVPEAYG
ncbi:MAG: carbon-nitrogen family hydrolase [Pseudomonadota bacterium]